MGGFPCQAFSVAGYQKGFKDPRGNLFFEICRAITELPKMPKAVMLENVKNIRGHDGGKTAKVITKSLRDLGYSVFWNVFNTSVHTDIPQNRERTFIIGFKDEADWDFEPNKKTSSSVFNSYLPLAKSKTKKKFREMLNLGFSDVYRHFNEDKEGYTFWDYMRGAWQKNNGMRIDHFLVSNSLIDLVKDININKDPRGREKPSDHTPIEIKLA